jgi:TolB-like protein
MADPMTGAPSPVPGYQRFFAELKRRRVFRVMAVYGAVGFALLQALDLLMPALLLPEWTYRLVAVLLFLGFPVAVVLAWAFESTPEGIRRTADADPGELTAIAAQPAAKRWPVGLAALAATGLFAGAVWGGLRATGPGGEPGGTAADAGATAPSAVAERRGAPAPASEPTSADALGSRQAVAVLPFADLAGTDESRAFALGLHDDLMTQLTKVPDLKVTSRTSVMAYAEGGRPVREIADELRVGSIVEGGVRTAGGRVRLNVQLIDPATDEHIWAETYDSELTAETVFEIQGEIARAVATALEAELSPEQTAALGEVLTDDIEAWNAYHAGKLLEDRQDDETSERRTVELFERAVELDPGFTAAWARLVRARAWLLRRGLSSDTLPARRSLDRLRAIDPDGPDTRFAEGIYQYYAIGDYAAALAAFEDALRARPGDPEFLQFSGWVLRRLGRWDEALARLERAIELDPRNASLLWNQGLNYYRLRELARGRRLFERALGLDPAGSTLGGWLVELELFTAGDSAAARRAFESGLGMESPGMREAVAYWLAYARRDGPAAIAHANRITGGWARVETSSTNRRSLSRAARLALAHRMAGDEAKAATWADSAVAEARSALASRPAPEPRDRFGVASVAHASLGYALAIRGAPGDAEEAVRHAEEAVRLYGPAEDAMDSDFAEWLLVRTYVLTGRSDDAVDRIESILSRPHSFGLGDLTLDPLYDVLRSDPRFAALVTRLEEMIER